MIKRIIIRLIPDLLWDLYRRRRYSKSKSQTNSVGAKSVFTKIYQSNFWNSRDSLSGTGSDDSQTEYLRKFLPEIIREFGIKTFYDVPCGDFNWMRKVDLGSVDYTGADIVDELIEKNRLANSASNIHFEVLNLLEESPPKSDLIFCRDCLVHFSYEDINRAVKNIRNSGSKYLLTTSFVKRRLNFDISTGDWRPINLSIKPFNFPKPLRVALEGCTEGNGKSYDKAIVLYRIDDLDALVIVEG